MWWRSFWRSLCATAAYSVLMVLALSPFGLWPAALVAVVPLLWLVRREEARPRARVLGTFCGAAVFWGFESFWTWKISLLGFPPMVGVMSVYVPLFVWLAGRVRRRAPAWLEPFALAAVWVGVELLRGEVIFDGYSWGMLAHPLIEGPVAPRFGAIAGDYGVSFLVALFAGLLASVVFGGSSRRVRLVHAAVLGVPLVLVAVGPRAMDPRPLWRVGLVQTNVSQDNRVAWSIEQQVADFRRFLSLTDEASLGEVRPDLIVWPETMKPGMSLDDATVAAEKAAGLYYNVKDGLKGAEGKEARLDAWAFADALKQRQKEIGIPMVIGEDGFEGLRFEETAKGIVPRFDRRWNSVYVLKDGQVSPGRYDKIELTPFGEVMPYISEWPWLEQKMLAVGAHGMRFDLDPGRRMSGFEVPVGEGTPEARRMRIVTPICFEVTRAAYIRRLVAGEDDRGKRADAMVNLSNDGWFGDWDPGREQHLQIARWRCLELGVPMVRCVNTGISAIIDAEGGVWARGKARAEHVLGSDVPSASPATFFARHGAWVYRIMWVLFGAFAAAGLIPRRKAAASEHVSGAPQVSGAPRASGASGASGARQGGSAVGGGASGEPRGGR